MGAWSFAACSGCSRHVPRRAAPAAAAAIQAARQLAQWRMRARTLTCAPCSSAEKRKAEAGGGEGEEGEEALRLELEAAEFERAKVRALGVHQSIWFSGTSCLPCGERGGRV